MLQARPAARASTRAKKPDNVAKASAMDQLKAARARKAQPRRSYQVHAGYCCNMWSEMPMGAPVHEVYHSCFQPSVLNIRRVGFAGCGRTRIGRVSRPMSAAMRASAGAAAALQVGG